LTRDNTEGGAQLIDVGNHRLLLRCAGVGWPPVVLDAGLGDRTTSPEWTPIQHAIAAFTQCCSYDRAGLGASDPWPGAHTSLQAVDDLYRLLHTAEVAGPYVLVGHSLGGLHAQLFAAHYPSETAGLVLIDSTHEDHFAWLVRNELSSDEMDEQRRFAAGDNSENIAFDTALVALREAKWRLDVPLIVLIRDRVPPEEQPLVWSPEREARLLATAHELQADLASRSPHGRLVIAEGSGHNIQRYRPDLIIEAIREVVAAARE
ncbi:MAG TPA: alpha/beta hydrolase, partial [Ktedonobacterales bacterium]|nr:alpha/beta hydrolase [Ktedonobacterales bacterium]